MTIKYRILKQFFEEEIVNLDEDTVEDLLSRYPVEQVIQCLFDELKSLQYGDDAWRLARVFADISQKYSVDTHIYSWLKSASINENKIFLNFLAGYYYNASPNVNILTQLAELIMDVISRSTILGWDEENILLAIESVVYGYARIKYFVRENTEIKEKVKQQIIVFKKYVLNTNLTSSDHQMIAGMLERWDLGIS